ncbi:MAG: GNAT family N-acetyltransferase [Chromatiales bacterium]|nr:GNAT family N-acetyltransferase [Chromatiales bacterium]
MGVLHLDALLRPASVALVGASGRAGSVGAKVLANLKSAGFGGSIYPVNPRHSHLDDMRCWPDVQSLPLAPDLAVICIPAPGVPACIDALGQAGCHAAVIITAGFDERGQQALLDAARPYGLRLLGPNCLGLLVPGIGLNASFAPGSALAGQLAFISQSGAMATIVLDWANQAGIGFSHFISLGNAVDVDFGDLLDWLGSDPATSAVLVYLESVTQARKFMSSARAAARNKPVIVLKGGRSAAGQQAAQSHTGALTSSDAVYSAAFQRAGMLRVHEFADLFAAAETLARCRPIRGDRLLVLTNGGGPGVLATDLHVMAGGRMAVLGEVTVAQLRQVLPQAWSGQNPLDIVGDAEAGRYLGALEALEDCPDIDALLLLHAPTAVAGSEETAEQLLPALRALRWPVLTCWPGGIQARAARARCAAAGIAAFPAPEDAVRGLHHLLEYQRNQDALIETPSWPAEDGEIDLDRARALVQRCLSRGIRQPDTAESLELLEAFGIPAAAGLRAGDPASAADAAAQLGGPVALKLLSRDISHKSDVGGVVLDLESPQSVAEAARRMQERIANSHPEAALEGFLVQRMVRRAGSHELLAGIATDPVFGPVIVFGQGGTAVEVIADRSIGLPPLNLSLARQLIERTSVSRLLAGYRDQPPADIAAISDVLVRLACIVIELPQLAQLDINPLLAGPRGVCALDARIVLEPAAGPAGQRLAIRPYPSQLEGELRCAGQVLRVRPIRPEDEPAYRAFLARMGPEDLRMRFFGMVRALSHSELARDTQIDYDREMALVATGSGPPGTAEILGIVRTIADRANTRAEFALAVDSRLKRAGLGTALMSRMLDYCRARGLREVVGFVLRDNQPMLALARRLGFSRDAIDEDQFRVSLRLDKRHG